MTQRSNSPYLFFVLLIVIAAGRFGIDLYVPSLPAMSHLLQTSQADIQTTITVFLLSNGVGGLVFGPISDSVGRRPLMLTGMLLFAGGACVCALTSNIHLIWAARFLQGIGVASTGPIAFATISDLYKDNALIKANSWAASVNGLIPAIAPCFGGIIQAYAGWRANFFFMAVFGGLGFVLLWIFFRESLVERKPFSLQSTFGIYLEMLTHPRFVTYLILTFCGFSIAIVFAVMAPFLFQKVLHYSALQFGGILLITGLAFFTGSSLNQVLAWSPIRKKWLSSILLAVSSAAVFLPAYFGILNPYCLIVPASLAFFASGILFPVALSSALSCFPQNSGAAMALVAFSAIIGSMAVSFIATFLHTETPLPMAGMFVTISLITLGATALSGIVRK